MGGAGSGRRSQASMVPHRDRQPDLTVTELTKKHVFTAGQPVQWSTKSRDGLFTEVTTCLIENKVIIVILSAYTAKKLRTVQATVELSYSACNFGGQRAWFLCPGRSQKPCGRRVGKLYIVRSALLCRYCGGFGYESDHAEAGFRQLHRAQQLIRRLGGSGSLAYSFPPRPKHMHWDTYLALYRRVSRHLESWVGVSKDTLEKAHAICGVKETRTWKIRTWKMKTQKADEALTEEGAENAPG